MPEASSATVDQARAGRNGAASVLRLPADLGIEHAATLKSQLQQLAAEAGDVTLEAEDVERIHGAALQLFCLFCRDRRAGDREVHFAKPSKALASAAALFGASALLQIAGSQQ
jgi:ABC-type transporter Mla MlaB component